MSDQNLAMKQTDQIEIILAFKEQETKRPAAFDTRLDLTLEERKLKVTVDNKFITCMSVLTSTKLCYIYPGACFLRLRSTLCPDMKQEHWEKITPKEIGRILQEWFESLDNDQFTS